MTTQVERLIEPVVYGITTFLTNELPAQLTAITAGYSDGIVLDPPAAVFDYMPARSELVFPCACVLPGQSQTRADAGGWMDGEHAVSVAVFVQEQETRALSYKLLRYQRAVIELVQAHRNGYPDRDGNMAWTGLNFVQTVPGDRFRHDSNPKAYVDHTTIMLRAMRQENF